MINSLKQKKSSLNFYAFSLWICLLVLVGQVSVASAIGPDDYLVYKQKLLGGSQAEFMRIVKSYSQEPSVIQFQKRLVLIDEVGIRLVNHIQQIESYVMENYLAEIAGVVNTSESKKEGEEVLDAYNIYAIYSGRFSDLPIPPIVDAEVNFLREYYKLNIRAACDFILTYGGKAAAMNTYAKYEVYRASIVLPFLTVQDGAWSSQQINSLQGRCKKPEILRLFEDFALRLQRPFTALAFAQYGQDKPWALAAKIAYLVKKGEALATKGEYSCGLFQIKFAIGLADESGSDELVADTRLGLAKWYNKIGRVRLAAAVVKEAMDESKNWIDYGQAASLRIMYLYEAKQFDTIKKEAAQYQKQEKCKAYMPQIIYISWLAHKHLDMPEEAQKLMNLFLERYQQNPLCADLYYAQAIEAMYRGDYNEALRLMELIVHRYPSSRIIKNVKKLEARLTDMQTKAGN